MDNSNKAGVQLIARCIFNKDTGKTKYENYMRYYQPCEEE